MGVTERKDIKKLVIYGFLLLFCFFAVVNASIPNGNWIGDWFVEKNVNATVSVKSPLGIFGNITSPVFVNWIVAKVGAGATPNDIWTFATRTLTNLSDVRASLIDNLDVLLSTRANQTSVDNIPKAVWEYATRTLTSGGTGGANATEVWTYVTRTLTNLSDVRASLIDNLDVLLSTRANQTSVDNIHTDVGTAISKIDVIDGLVDTLTTNLATVDGLIDTLTTNLADLHTDVGTAITNIGTVITNVGDLHTDVGTAISKIDVVDDYVDTEVADIHTDIGTLSSSVTSSYTPYGYTAPETYTTANPVQNQWYTAFDTTGIHGFIVALSLTNGDTTTKSFDVKLTVDGTALTLSGKSMTTGLTVYIYVTSPLDDTLTSSSAMHTFTYEYAYYIHYKTSLKLEYRTISADVDSMTVKFRRVQ